MVIRRPGGNKRGVLECLLIERINFLHTRWSVSRRGYFAVFIIIYLGVCLGKWSYKPIMLHYVKGKVDHGHRTTKAPFLLGIINKNEAEIGGR